MKDLTWYLAIVGGLMTVMIVGWWVWSQIEEKWG